MCLIKVYFYNFKYSKLYQFFQINAVNLKINADNKRDIAKLITVNVKL